MTRENRRGSGQSLVEFAIILPILFIMVMVIFDLGRIVYFYSAIHNAAREGARYGSIYNQSNAGDIQSYATSLLVGVDQSALTMYGPCFLADEDVIKLKIEYQFSPATAVMSLLTGSGDFTLQTQSTMQLEYDLADDGGDCSSF